MITSNVKQATKMFDKKITEIDTKTKTVRDVMMSRLIQLAQEEIKGERPYRTTGPSSAKSAQSSYLLAGFFSPESYRNFAGAHAAFSKSGGRVYEKAISGQPPMNRTGNLRRSITGAKAREGFAKYSATVGPTMVYSRAVELGGAPNWHNGENFPYMKPALQKFQREAMAIVRKYLA